MHKIILLFYKVDKLASQNIYIYMLKLCECVISHKAEDDDLTSNHNNEKKDLVIKCSEIKFFEKLTM